MEKLRLYLEVTSVIFMSLVALSAHSRQYGACSQDKTNYLNCRSDKFECLSDSKCIDRSNHCDGIHHCSDGSDENYCNEWTNCPTSPKTFRRCNQGKCIPYEWICDGHSDCPYGDDEENCLPTYNKLHLMRSPDISSTHMTKKAAAIEWLKNQSEPDSATRKWGPFVHKLAVALYLSNPEFSTKGSSLRKEITYELSIQMLSRLAKKRIQNITSSDIASFINAFLVTCTDPRDFHGFNLVEVLRSRVDKQNYTNPYILLTLCNAGDAITDSDVKKLVEVFWSKNRELWTDTQAMALMALSCAKEQTHSPVDAETITELALELKQHQYRNGTVENLQTTLLVMQALYAAESDEDSDNFDEKKALAYILENSQSDGSFGNLLSTYYALPVLSCKSMVNISSSHCFPVQKDEDTATFDLMNLDGPKIHVRYSVWIGMERDIERTLTLRVPTNTSFYGVMEYAAEIDSRYRFDYVVRKRKPYINAVSGIPDDLENEHFWFPYIIKDAKETLLEKSTADVIPKNHDHIIMWYRGRTWEA